LVRKPDDWILAVVTRFIPEKNKYEVEDVDEEEEQKKYLLPKSSIIPLPTMEENPATKGYKKRYEFQKDAPVLAIFPNTTCFYRAHVVSVPRGVSGKNASENQPLNFTHFFFQRDSREKFPIMF
jgi:hypothetical protein